MKRAFLALFMGVSTALCFAQRSETELRTWDFSRDGESWKQVRVPHDWAISGPFDKKWDLQTVAIEQNGETEATEKSGRSGSLPWIGEGHYKTTINIAEPIGFVELVFDGAMSEPVVSINGKKAGEWKYGYNAFRVDISKFVHPGANEVRVDLSNIEESSRWYPGGGIYRPVKLVTTPKARLDRWGLFFRTLRATGEEAAVAVDATVKGAAGNDWRAKVVLVDNDGTEQCLYNNALSQDGGVHATARILKPRMWSPEEPNLYTLRTLLYNKDGQVVDEISQRVGIRTVAVSKEKGFQLNGVSRKLKGVCLHHDLGPLGAAVNRAALIRQVRILKDMGCDAIRTSHNMPSTMQMEIYDSLGMMVMAESFDMWVHPKCKNGYARFFKEWGDRDIENLVLNHRNHPSIVMWSIGNEIYEQWMTEGVQMATHMQDLIHQLDPTRPVTQGMDRPDDATNSGFMQAMDIPGFNYRVKKYDEKFPILPQGFVLGSETASTVSSRGVYKFPAEVKSQVMYPDGQCSGYDTEFCSWSNLPDDDFFIQDERPWTIGQFVWTGFDYLGEPTPYDEYWPSRSSYFGICDLAGLPKDRFWLYRSKWNETEHTIHLLPHWTWTDRKGEVTPVYCYTDYPSAELFVNGKSQGRRSKDTTAKENLKVGEISALNVSLDRYRLRWNDVRYEPGELKVVVYDENGQKAGEQTIRTAGKPSKLQLDADRIELRADGDDMAFVTVSLTDSKGTLIPDADDQLTFSVSGAARYEAACNGDATSLEVFTDPTMKLFKGQLVVVVRASEVPGTATLTVTDPQRKLTKKLQIVVK